MKLSIHSSRIYRCISVSAALAGVMLAGVGLGQPAIADARPVFGESPQAIESYFGPYWTRLTMGANVTYTYSPGELTQIFPAANFSRFDINFENGQATSVNVLVTMTLSDILEGGYPRDLDAMFEYIFGYAPSSESSVYQQRVYEEQFLVGGTLHGLHYCVNDGIVMFYEYVSDPDYLIYASFSPDEACAVSD
jgi:hypothetical protein